MARRFSTRSEYLYEHFISSLGDATQLAVFDPSALDTLRKGLLIIGQESRFDLFLLISGSPNELTLEQLSSKLHLGRDKVQYHLYSMLSHGVILAAASEGRTVFRPNPLFRR